MYFHSIDYTIYVQDMSNLHTQMLSVSFRDFNSFVSRWEGRRDWEGMK